MTDIPSMPPASSIDQAVPARLKQAGLRPTRQRLALASLLFEGGPRHVTAEQLQGEASSNAIKVSLATIYNTLHQFTEAGLLREVVIEPGRSYFDTNIDDHHHFYVEGSGQLLDIPGDTVSLACLPTPPAGTTISRVDVIIRIGPARA
ncbi:MAG TPA: Fur family transcriptional regulator [Aliidongia sp.]|uniref:iron response transcriptional regulator IrrA n=1 Tax=Aliidongia sp. TaxID=1914230 RepID=UPI002DDD4E03|nr:Fur family transcriptional regulator [Aliidongia sp.]HEV2673949.1 Fur family transcriptional regulator [Aliidongia sp.]